MPDLDVGDTVHWLARSCDPGPADADWLIATGRVVSVGVRTVCVEGPQGLHFLDREAVYPEREQAQAALAARMANVPAAPLPIEMEDYFE